jgi:hypothetical protein
MSLIKGLEAIGRAVFITGITQAELKSMLAFSTGLHAFTEPDTVNT